MADIGKCAVTSLCSQIQLYDKWCTEQIFSQYQCDHTAKLSPFRFQDICYLIIACILF